MTQITVSAEHGVQLILSSSSNWNNYKEKHFPKYHITLMQVCWFKKKSDKTARSRNLNAVFFPLFISTGREKKSENPCRVS